MMKSPSESSSGDKSKQLDGHRRSFLGRLLAGGVAIAAVPAIAALARGGDEEVVKVVPVKGKGKGGKGKAAGGGMGGPVANAEALAERMIAEFDKDGDKALNQAELAAAIEAVHARGQTSLGRGTVGGKSQGGVAGQGRGSGGGRRGSGTDGASAGGGAKGGGRGGRG